MAKSKVSLSDGTCFVSVDDAKISAFKELDMIEKRFNEIVFSIREKFNKFK
jgi:hypothetical protein